MSATSTAAAVAQPAGLNLYDYLEQSIAHRYPDADEEERGCLNLSWRWLLAWLEVPGPWTRHAQSDGQVRAFALTVPQTIGLDLLTAHLATALGGGDPQRFGLYTDLAYLAARARSHRQPAPTPEAMADYWLNNDLIAAGAMDLALVEARQQILARATQTVAPLCAWIRTGCPGAMPPGPWQEVAP